MLELFIPAILVRLLGINQGLWLDEAIGAIAAKNYTYSTIITDFLTHDNHPPLYYLFLKFWTSVFGFSDVSIRAPSVICGVIVVFLVYKLTKKFAPKIMTLATAATALSPFLVYYSHEARMYIFASAWALLAIYAFLSTFKAKTNKFWVLFSISIVGLLFTDYMPVFLLPVFPLYAYLQKVKRGWWAKFVLSFLPLLVLGVIWFPILMAQVQGGSTVLQFLPEWKNVAGGATFKEAYLVWTKFLLGRISIQPKTVYALALLVFSIPALFSLFASFKKRDKFTVFVWIWLAVPLITSFIASFFFPAFTYFRFTFLVPAFLILISDGITKVKRDSISLLCTILFIVGAITGLVIYLTDTTQQREDWRGAVSFVETDATADSVVLFEFPEGFAPYRWYSSGKVKQVGGLSEIKAQPGDEDLLPNKLENVKRVYYFEYLRDLTDPGNVLQTKLAKEGYAITKEVGDYRGVGIIKIWEKK